jgi:hypothetical protein
LIVLRPSPLVRWPLHALSAMFVLVIGLLAGVAALFAWMREPTPWTLLVVGGGACVLFIAVNTTVAAMRLTVTEDLVALRVGPWRRAASLDEAVVIVEESPVGVTGLRVVPASGAKPLWVSAAWFRGFDAALDEIGRSACARGGVVTRRSCR